MQNTLYTFQAKDLVCQRDKEKEKKLYSTPTYLQFNPRCTSALLREAESSSLVDRLLKGFCPNWPFKLTDEGLHLSLHSCGHLSYL